MEQNILHFSSKLRTYLLCQEDTGVGAGVKGVGCDHLPKVVVQLKSNFSTFASKYTLYMYAQVYLSESIFVYPQNLVDKLANKMGRGTHVDAGRVGILYNAKEKI